VVHLFLQGAFFVCFFACFFGSATVFLVGFVFLLVMFCSPSCEGCCIDRLSVSRKTLKALSRPEGLSGDGGKEVILRVPWVVPSVKNNLSGTPYYKDIEGAFPALVKMRGKVSRQRV
jgi:hypothetical protein